MVFHFRFFLQNTKLPFMLHSLNLVAMQRCSKGAQGLSVQPQEVRICTDNSNSLSSCWRQWGSRYTIHARRNLPDKEFRYLRTVRVTAAVYWGLKSMLAQIIFTFQHRAGVRPYTSSYDFAESCVFTKQSPPLLSCHLKKKVNFLFGLSFSLSYRANLPSSFNMILLSAFVY